MKIGIIGAMEEEVEILREKITDMEQKTIAGCEFYSGNINGTSVVLLKSGIGKVNAAMATTLLIQIHKPDYIINTGSAGGLHSRLKVGDIVISDELRYHDVDATVFGYEYGQVPGMPPKYLSNRNLVYIAEQCAKKIDVKTRTGLVTTGDSFLSDLNRVNQIRSKFKDLFAVEMEATAIAQVCFQFKVHFVIIRSLSDIAGKDAKVSYDQFLKTASKNSAELVLLMIKEIDKVV